MVSGCACLDIQQLRLPIFRVVERSVHVQWESFRRCVTICKESNHMSKEPRKKLELSKNLKSLKFMAGRTRDPSKETTTTTTSTAAPDSAWQPLAQASVESVFNTSTRRARSSLKRLKFTDSSDGLRELKMQAARTSLEAEQ